MRLSTSLVVLVVATSVAAPGRSAAAAEQAWSVTALGGSGRFSDGLRFHIGGRLAWQYRWWIGVEGAGGFTPMSETAPNGRDIDWRHASGNLVLSPAKGRLGGPYAFVGGGWMQAEPSTGPKSERGTIEFGGGLRLWMTDCRRPPIPACS